MDYIYIIEGKVEGKPGRRRQGQSCMKRLDSGKESYKELKEVAMDRRRVKKYFISESIYGLLRKKDTGTRGKSKINNMRHGFTKCDKRQNLINSFFVLIFL